MREIKFRAWDNREKVWLDEVTVYSDGSWSGKKGDVDGYSQEDECILMQYTGLKDKNGKEIYEGDIIKHDNGQISVVEWSQGDWGWFMKSIRNWNPKTGFDSSKDEVIGNIYENPELI